MPYKNTKELPKSVTDNLPSHAEEIYKEAFNSAWEQYDKPEERRENASQEEVAYKVAWSAVKQKYEKNEEGKWIQKS
ncbi:MAG TPA: ChaB family protein [Candidatus Woesebacteria bacterium]|nr:ChaB family protein [Candidatus Woesebacteria bacterium]